MRDKLISLLALLAILPLTACDLNPSTTPSTGTPAAVSSPSTVATNTVAAMGKGVFAYIATDGSLHLRDLASADVPLSRPLYSSGTPLPADAARTAAAAFSPDGKYLAYRPLQSNEVHVIDVATTLQSGPPWVLAATIKNVTGSFAWSADSLNLAVQTKTMVGSSKPISPDAVTIITLANTSGSSSYPDLNGAFVWSPDGKRLAYASSDAIQLASALDNHGISTSRDNPIAVSGLYDMKVLNWSPHSRYITLSAAVQAGATPNLYLFDTQSKQPPVLVDDGAYSPQWSFDGKLLCYQKSVGDSAFGYGVLCRQLGGNRNVAIVGVYKESAWVIAPFIYDGPSGKGYLINETLVSMDNKIITGVWSAVSITLGWSPVRSERNLVAIVDVEQDPISRTLGIISIPDGKGTPLYTIPGVAFTDTNKPKMDAVWSPSGKYLAFIAAPLKSDAVSGVFSLDGKEIASGLRNVTLAGWVSANGNETALFADSSPPALYGLQPGGGKAVKLADGVFLASRPSK